MTPKRKAKDVKSSEPTSRRGRSKKITVDSLPKILDLARQGGSLQAQRVKCGKPNCRCARGSPHEGYYYLFLWSPQGVSKHYVRRGDVPAVRAAVEERRRFRRTWRAELRGALADIRRMVLTMEGVKR